MADRTHDALPALIPLETLFGNPDRVSPQISPDGRYLTFIAPDEGVLNVWLRERDGGEARPLTRDRGRGIRHHGWAHEGGVVLYLQDRDGDENWRLFACDLEAGTERALTPDDPSVTHPVQAQIVGSSPRRPHELLVGLNRRDERVHDVYRLDLRSGALTRIAEGTPETSSWLIDHDLTVRGFMRTETDGSTTLILHDGPGGAPREVLAFPPEDALVSGPLRFSKDGTRLFLDDSRGRDAAALVELDLATGALSTIAADSRHDVARVHFHPTEHTVQMVAFERARREWIAIDPAVAADLEHLRRATPGEFGLVDRTLDDRVWLVGFIVDDGPVRYAIWHRDTATLEHLFVHREALVGLPLAPMEPFHFVARDGLEVHGYLTRPMGVAPPYPLVLNVHGGPWVRDTWGYDPEAQWLANRGYACIQVNYRGSTGYGKAFVNAGDREWGGRMQDDLSDAVRFAIDQGWADPARVAIYGGSYGGYATLAGVTFTPELYRCGVSIVGPSNLETFLNTVPPYWESFRAMLDRRVGRIPRYASGERAGLPKDARDFDDDERREMEFIHARSPLFHVERVRCPMLVAQGANDPRVKKAESDQFVAAMRAKGLAVDYVVYDDEGHGFARPENRLDFYRRAEAFLAEHLGGRSET
ncbi:MAG: S9 family peptidase [Acidobacteria bacterium]|nr:S9 family peptidase [Acidobacteriota bacterium]